MAAVSWSAFQFVTKPLFSKYSGMTLLLYQSIFGVMGFLPFLKYDYINISNLDMSVWGHFMFLTVFCSALATYFYLFGQKTLGINITSVFLNLIPMFTFVFSFVFLKEVMSLVQIFGALIVIVSVSCVKEEVCSIKKKSEDVINIREVFEGE
ncbi:MAG: DMT family transporter, partial [Proteocatella sp.]